MGRLLRENPANSQLLGGSRRAGTLRSRVRVIQKFIVLLTTAHNVAFPLHWKHLIEYFQVRLSEALRAWVTETATYVIHTPPGGRGHPGQIHRRCVVRCHICSPKEAPLGRRHIFPRFFWQRWKTV